jgi:hypothetical protein
VQATAGQAAAAVQIQLLLVGPLQPALAVVVRGCVFPQAGPAADPAASAVEVAAMLRVMQAAASGVGALAAMPTGVVVVAPAASPLVLPSACCLLQAAPSLFSL